MRSLICSMLFVSAIATAAAAAAELGPVQVTDTLWKLATQARPDEQVAMVQVVYALWQANPRAFNQHNINALRAGSKLKVPTRQQMLAMPVAQARRWYQQALAGHIAASDEAVAGQSKAHQPVSSIQQAPTGTAAASLPQHSKATLPMAAPVAVPATTEPAVMQQSDAAVQADWRQNLSADYNLTLQQRYYPQTGAQGQAKAHSSVALSAEWVWLSDDRAHQIAVEPFLRWDQRDSERNLLDLRQAYWQFAGDGYDIKAGVDIVFWGVTESQHLVDVINQTDLVASVDGEAKLGQPMLNWNMYGDGGTLALYLLPYFRERTLPGIDGRLRLPLPFANDDPLYESAQAENNLDFALRWSRQFDALDIGLSYFEGNNRDPQFLPTADGQLRPVYLQMQQLGLDAQLISGSWIWKLESIYRKTRLQDVVAATAGFEYTQVGLFGSDWDLGWIAEYQYDSRDELAPVPGQHDLFVGGRFVANDVAGSEILLGLVQDLDNSNSQSGKLEASMRLGNSIRLRLDAWLFRSQLPTETLYFIRRDDYVQLSLEYYF
jgi:FimV-like protein